MAKGGGKRTYARDSRGRFASTGSGASKGGTLSARSSLKKSRNKLAAKDKADQSFSGTLSRRAQKGAVTRGNKALKAAKVSSRRSLSIGKVAGTIGKGGKLKGMQVAKPKTMQGVSHEKGGKKRQTKTERVVRPREIYRGNFRPRNVTGKPQKAENPFGLKNQAKKTGNLDIALKWLQKKGYGDADIYKERSRNGGQAIARAATRPGGRRTYKDLNGEYKSETVPARTKIQLNQYSSFWKNPAQSAREQRKRGWMSTSSPVGALWHEIGHSKDKYNVLPSWARVWVGNKATTSGSAKQIAQRVSKYATYSPGEFVAETYAGRRTGRKYDHQVMDAYRQTRGLPSLRLKDQKPIRRKRKVNP